MKSRTSMALSILMLVSLSCATFREGAPMAPGAWPPTVDGQRKSISIKATHAGMPFFSDGSAVEMGSGADALVRGCVWRQFVESGVFSKVEITESATTDLRADVRWTTDQSHIWVLSILSVLTVGIVPMKTVTLFEMETSVSDGVSNREIAVIKKEGGVKVWGGWIMLAVPDDGSTKKVEEEVRSDVVRATILEGLSLGIF